MHFRMRRVTSFADRFRGISGNVSKGPLFFTNAPKWFPGRVLSWVFEHSKYQELVALRHNGGLVRKFARNLLGSKKKEAKEGDTQRDIMNLLGMINASSVILGLSAHHQLAVRSSASPRPDRRPSDDEIIFQARYGRSRAPRNKWTLTLSQE